MGYSRTVSAPVAAAEEKWERPAGYLNIYVMSGEKKMKLGNSGLPLKASRAIEKKIIDALEADPSKIDSLKGKLVIEYRSGTPEDNSGDFSL